MMRDVILTLRSLRKTPFVTAAVVLSLALGIGANTAIFSFMDQMLLRSLPVENPHELVFVDANHPKSGSTSSGSAGGQDAVFSYPMMRDLVAMQTSLRSLAGFRDLSANIAYQGNAISGTLQAVTGNYFDTLGAKAGLGRTLTEEDDRERQPLAVLSYRYWQDRLGSDASVINQKIVVNGVPMTVVGVTARGFHGTTTGTSPDLWTPISLKPQLTPNWDGTEDRRYWWVYLVGRLKPGASIEQSAAGLQVLLRSLLAEEAKGLPDSDQEFRDSYARGTAQLTAGGSGRGGNRDNRRNAFIAMMAATLMVLLIACANVANLQLVRAANRGRDIAVRIALGSGRWPVFRQMLTESMVLGALGTLGGILVARAVTELLIMIVLPPEAPRGILTAELDTRILLFTLSLGLLTGIAFGTYPSLAASRIAVSGSLKEQSGQVLSAGAARIRKGLVMAQMALSLMLLVLAGLCTRSMVNLSRVDVGFSPENLIAFGVSPRLNGYNATENWTLARRAVAELGSMPGVTGVAMSEVPFLGGSRWGANITVEGYTNQPGDVAPLFARVGSGLFRTMGVALREGREFTDADGPGAPKVVVVNEQFEKQYFGGGSALGRRMALGEGNRVVPDMEIVGVVRDMKYAGVKDTIPPLFYMPLAQNESLDSFFLYVRSGLPAEAVIPQIRQAMAGIDPNLPLERLRTMTEQVAMNMHDDRTMVRLSAAFAILATLLAVIGLYGVMAYNVASRTREIGVRMAFGADAWPIQWMVLREAAWVLGIGAAIGLVAAYWLTSYVQSLLFEVASHDALVYVAATVLVGLAGLVAALLPARRAASVDPMTCLRYE